MKIFKYLTLSLILIAFSLLYLATSYQVPCEDDCAKVYSVDTTMSRNRDYVFWVSRCSGTQQSDSLCVYVKDTIGINWNLLADTVCAVATQNGLARQKIFIIKTNVTPPDTVARKICP
jgi:hypothetical protein